MPKLAHRLAPFGSLLLLAGLVAQAPSPWATIHVPTGVPTPAMSSQGKIVLYRAPGTLHVYSAMTRNFGTVALSPAATVRLNNDCLLVQDGTTWTAYSGWLGRFVPLTVTATAALVNPAGAVNDSLILVGDGNQLHTFSAFTGTWVARSVTPGWSASVQRHTAVLADNGILGGCDASTGQWTDLPVTPGIYNLTADGTAGFAIATSTVFAFSASHRTWHSHGLPPGATFVRADDWGVFHTTTRMLGFSAIRATFATSPLGASGALATQDTFAIMNTGAGPVAFSSFTGRFSEPLAPLNASVATGTAVAMFQDGTTTYAFSAVLGRTERRPGTNPAPGAANVIGWAMDATTGRPAFYSALTGLWYEAPANALPADPTVTTAVAAAPTPTGCVAFSPRHGTFVPLLDPTIQLTGNGMSAPILAIGTTSLHTFDARFDRWVSTPRTGTGTVQVGIWRTSLLAIDGNTMNAWGSQAGTWASASLPGPVVGLRANSESLRVHTALDVFAYSAMAEVAAFGQFPEFRRVQPASEPVPLCVVVPANGIAVLAVGLPSAAAMPIPALGMLWLEPASLATLPVVGNPSGEGVLLTLPAIGQAAAGLELGLQAVQIAPGGAAWLTEPATLLPLGI